MGHTFQGKSTLYQYILLCQNCFVKMRVHLKYILGYYEINKNIIYPPSKNQVLFENNNFLFVVDFLFYQIYKTELLYSIKQHISVSKYGQLFIIKWGLTPVALPILSWNLKVSDKTSKDDVIKDYWHWLFSKIVRI